MRKPVNIKDRIRDKDVLDAYSKYELYLQELDIYDKYMQENGKVNITKAYKDIGINDKKGVKERFQKLISEIDIAKKQNPQLDLRDIRTQEGRRVVSGIISETQNSKDFKPTDLSDVAVIENLALYAAVRDVNEKLKFKDVALVHYDLTEDEFDKAQESLKKYRSSEIMQKFNGVFKNTDSIVHYAAAVVEETPINVCEAFKRLGLEKGKFKSKNLKNVTIYKVSQLVIDNILKDDKLTPTEKSAKINELQLDEIDRKQKMVDDANQKFGGEKYKAVMEDSDQR